MVQFSFFCGQTILFLTVLRLQSSGKWLKKGFGTGLPTMGEND